MGCRLSGQWTDQKKGGKGREKSRRHRKEFHFLDEYGQPVTVQVEGRKGRRHHQCYTTDCSTQTERHWEALRRLGVVEGSEPALGGYAQGPYYDPRTLPPDLYSANGYLPSVSYGVDEIDSLDYQDSDMLSYQPNNRSCLIGCCNTDQEEPSSLLSQGEYESGWLEPPLGYLPLHERDSGLGCTDGSIHQGELSEPESEEGPEEAVSSPPGHTSRGSSSSSESLLSSELSDSGFHSISTGEFRRFQKILDGRMHSRRTRHLPRDQWPGSKARWDLESIPESRASEQTPASHQCTMGNSGQIRNARSPSLGRRQAGPSLAASCRTEPCQRRAFRLNQHTSMELPGRSYTMQDLSDRRRASHPALPLEHQGCSRQAKEERRGRLGTQGSQGEAAWQGEYRQERRAAEAGAREQYITTTCQRQSSDSQGPTNRPASGSGSGCGSGGTADWRGVQTLAPLAPQPDPACSPLYNTLGGGSPRSRTPRMARNQLLKARASRLADERSEVTTDEEARGEGWAGRYWNRTERRRHLALARQQRQRKAARGGAEGVRKEGGGGLETSCGGVSSGAGCRSVLELSHRKQSRLRNHKLLDDWTTVEELLTHGTRLGLDQTLCPSPLLSVTTV